MAAKMQFPPDKAYAGRAPVRALAKRQRNLSIIWHFLALLAKLRLATAKYQLETALTFAPRSQRPCACYLSGGFGCALQQSREESWPTSFPATLEGKWGHVALESAA